MTELNCLSFDDFGVTLDQFKNLLSFAILISDESPGVLNIAPRYILEKFDRFIGLGCGDAIPSDGAWKTGMHPTLRVLFDRYCQKWGIFTPYEAHTSYTEIMNDEIHSE